MLKFFLFSFDSILVPFTALFSVVILGRRLSGLKWLSLGVLTIGVATVEFSAQEPSEKSEEGSNHILGFMAIMAATVTSGFAGVYFEAVLKGARYVTSHPNCSLVAILTQTYSLPRYPFFFAGQACG